MSPTRREILLGALAAGLLRFVPKGLRPPAVPSGLEEVLVTLHRHSLQPTAHPPDPDGNLTVVATWLPIWQGEAVKTEDGWRADLPPGLDMESGEYAVRFRYVHRKLEYTQRFSVDGPIRAANICFAWAAPDAELLGGSDA